MKSKEEMLSNYYIMGSPKEDLIEVLVDIRDILIKIAKK